MKHQYFGDVNDYFKYGLLRCFSDSGMRIGICWMLTPKDHRKDGGKTEYLDKPNKWEHYDPELFNMIKEIGLKDIRKRHLRYAESFLPQNTKFLGEIVPDDKTKRASWFNEMKADLAGIDLVFFDPDNGIEVKSKPLGHKDSSKYVYWHELEEIWESGKSLLIFQHFAREKREKYIKRLRNDLVKHATNGTVYSIRSPNVLFLLEYHKDHEAHATKAQKALRLLETKWDKCLTIEPPIQ
jgi:hypothetical protein